MNIVLRGEKNKATKAMSEYAQEKLSKLNKYIENAEDVKATIVVKKRNHQDKVEITIPVKSFILRAEEIQEDFYAAIDVAIDKLERQLRKNKTRLQSQLEKNKKQDIFDFSNFEEMDDNDTEDVPTIVKRKKVEVKPMSEEEAILQMELLGHQFYLFKDADTNQPTVVYKRKDGNYGVIESE